MAVPKLGILLENGTFQEQQIPTTGVMDEKTNKDVAAHIADAAIHMSKINIEQIVDSKMGSMNIDCGNF